MKPWGDAETPYEQLGGADRSSALANTFYDVVEADSPTLRAMLPVDIESTRKKFADFMSGWLGGPQLYMERHGHPQLRMRHSRFVIGPAEAAEWTRCMKIALDRLAVGDALGAFLEDRLGSLAKHLINQDEAP